MGGEGEVGGGTDSDVLRRRTWPMDRATNISETVYDTCEIYVHEVVGPRVVLGKVFR